MRVASYHLEELLININGRLSLPHSYLQLFSIESSVRPIDQVDDGSPRVNKND